MCTAVFEKGGHPQERQTSLMWPEILATTTMNAFSSPCQQRHLSNVATITVYM